MLLFISKINYKRKKKEKKTYNKKKTENIIKK